MNVSLKIYEYRNTFCVVTWIIGVLIFFVIFVLLCLAEVLFPKSVVTELILCAGLFLVLFGFMFGTTLEKLSDSQKRANRLQVLVKELLTEKSVEGTLSRLANKTICLFETQRKHVSVEDRHLKDDFVVAKSKRQFWEFHNTVGQITNLKLKKKIGDYGEKAKTS